MTVRPPIDRWSKGIIKLGILKSGGGLVKYYFATKERLEEEKVARVTAHKRKEAEMTVRQRRQVDGVTIPRRERIQGCRDCRIVVGATRWSTSPPDWHPLAVPLAIVGCQAGGGGRH